MLFKMFKDTPTVCVCVCFCVLKEPRLGVVCWCFFWLFVFNNKERAEITVGKPDRFERNGEVKIHRFFWNLIQKHLDSTLPIGSMYGIYANIGDILMVNVTIYTIHGSYGLCNFKISTRVNRTMNWGLCSGVPLVIGCPLLSGKQPW